MLDDVIEVGKHQIDTVVLDGRKSDPTIDHDQIVLMLQHEHVAPDLSLSTEKDQLDGIAHGLFFSSGIKEPACQNAG